MATSTKLDLKPYYVRTGRPDEYGRIFYVGKGKSIRGNDHLKEAEEILKVEPQARPNPENKEAEKFPSCRYLGDLTQNRRRMR